MEQKEKLGFLQLIVLILSVYVLLALLIDTFFKLNSEVSQILELFDNLICVFFLSEFLFRFYKAESKIRFMKWGWIDLISSIPSFDFLRPGRVIRLFRLLRLLRAFRSTKILISYVFKNRKQGAFSSVAIISILLVIFSSIAILYFETDPNSNIKTAEDAIWWAFVTITTVGYGDKFPITTGGRIIAAILMTAGVGLFGTFTGFVASWFLEEKNK